MAEARGMKRAFAAPSHTEKCDQCGVETEVGDFGDAYWSKVGKRPALCSGCYSEWYQRRVERAQQQTAHDARLWRRFRDKWLELSRQQKRDSCEKLEQIFLREVSNRDLFADMLTRWKAMQQVQGKRRGPRGDDAVRF